jgi:hypothetical protein
MRQLDMLATHSCRRAAAKGYQQRIASSCSISWVVAAAPTQQPASLMHLVARASCYALDQQFMLKCDGAAMCM